MQTCREKAGILNGSPSAVAEIPVGDPRFNELIELLGTMEAPLHIGYTSGKGWDDPAIADLLIDNGLSELSFTVFATDPVLRKAIHA